VPLSIVSSESGTSAQAFFRDYLSQMNQSLYASQWGLFSKYALGYTPSSYVDDIWLDNESTWIYHSLDIDLNRFGESTEVGLSPSRTKTVVNYTRGAKKLKSLINKRLYDPDVFELAMYSRIPLHSALFATYSDPTRSENLFTRVFQETLIPDPSYPVQDMWIPFDMEERKKKFPKAFEELKVYMDYLRDHPVN
jgi:hypothetical protein